MKTLVFLFILFFAVSAEAIVQYSYMACGTSGVTYYALDKNNDNFYNTSTSDFDTGTYGTDAATQVGGGSSPVWKTDNLPYTNNHSYTVIFLDSGGSLCGAKDYPRKP